MTIKHLFAPSATGLGGAVVGNAIPEQSSPTRSLSKRCNQPTVTLGGVNHYVRRAAMLLLLMMLTTVTAWAEDCEVYVRISSLDQLKDNSKVIIAARYDDGHVTSYYAMPNNKSGRPNGVRFESSVAGCEILPSDITDDEDNYYWTVNVTDDRYTFTNADNQLLGCYGSTKFEMGGNNTAWTIESDISSEGAMVADYTGFVVKNVNNSDRDIAFNGQGFGVYKTSDGNMNAPSYNFFLDFFVLVPAIPYIDANGNTAYCTKFTKLKTGELPSGCSGWGDLPGGWYVVENWNEEFGENGGADFYREGPVIFKGNAHLILCDGAEMSVSVECDTPVQSSGTLTIYGQSDGSGTLNASNTLADGDGLLANEGLTINGGTISVSSRYGCAIRIGWGDVVINGGTVTATAGGAYAIYGNNVHILGGNVTANGTVCTDTGNGRGTITLGWRNATDQITATAYSGTTVKIADDQALKYTSGGTRTILGPGEVTLTADEVTAIAGQTLQPVIPVVYIAADGTTQKCFDYTVLKTDDPDHLDFNDLPGGWYVVENWTDGIDFDYEGMLSFQDDAHLILCDGAEMSVSVNGGTPVQSDKTLTIYGQSGGSGKLSVTNNLQGNGLEASDGLTINGGIISAIISDSYNAIHCGHGDVVINGGTVIATATADGAYAIYGYNVSILGGNITADGTVYAYPTGENHGTITLGCRTANDGITATSYSGTTVNIKSGQTLYDVSGNSYTDNDVTIPNNVTLRPFYSANFSVNATETEYTIHTAKGWGEFCDILDNSVKGCFTGKTVKMGTDIGSVDNPITRMAGTSGHNFTGIFDGQGYTLTVGYSGSDDGMAPFRYVGDCTIKNVRVAGTIETSSQHAAGIVAHQYGNVAISNCRSSVSIQSTVSGEGTHDGLHGGLVAENYDEATLTIEGCLFDGELLGTTTTSCGGFIGWRGGEATITNSLFAPEEVTVSKTESATFARNNVDTYNCYYTYLLCDGSNYVPTYVEAIKNKPAIWRNGKAVCTAEASPVYGAPQTYTVSGITAYANGLTRDKTFYYGIGDNVDVWFVRADGGFELQTAMVLGGTETVLRCTKDNDDDDLFDEGWYYVASDISYSQTVKLNRGVRLILADGCTMNIGTEDNRIDGTCIGDEFTIFGQDNQSGTLNVYSQNNDQEGNASINVGSYFQHGCNVNIDAEDNSSYALRGNVTFTGGTFTVKGKIKDNATLGWRTASDRIYATSYNGTVEIADGKCFYNDSEVISGSDIAKDKLDGKTLTPYGITLTANTNGSDYWTSFYSGAQSYRADATVYTAAVSGDKVNLTEVEGGVIPAGNAVLLKATATPIILQLNDAAASTLDGNDLHGVDVRTPLSNVKTSLGADAILVLSKKNETLGFYELATTNIPARKAFLALNGTTVKARELTIVFEGATGISHTEITDITKKAGAWFSLDGRRLTGEPTAKGIYVHNGNKVAIK